MPPWPEDRFLPEFSSASIFTSVVLRIEEGEIEIFQPTRTSSQLAVLCELTKFPETELPLSLCTLARVQEKLLVPMFVLASRK